MDCEKRPEKEFTRKTPSSETYLAVIYNRMRMCNNKNVEIGESESDTKCY